MKEYHILSLSGGKDSTALAFFIKDNMPEIFEELELVFFDTECELPETYDYLNKIEMFLNKTVKRMKPSHGFDHLYQTYRFLPSIRFRWCTIEMKTKIFRKYMSDKLKENPTAKINLYIGIRADEPSRIENYQKQNLESGENNLKTHYPLAEFGLSKKDVHNLLIASGIGFPDYYKWRSRSGCYFCFFQRKIEWVNLLETHPDLYQKALEYEQNGGKNFTWCQDMSLKQLKSPEVILEIKKRHQERLNKIKKENSKLVDIFSEKDEDDKCLFCQV